ncbi:hypothetical protein F1B92_04535 [Campylobacter sp. FMV-PI01]|uniref:Transcription factor zinc-finger domain-containing protein n=1 Tax=Campylobacter portucalensis TaxID=2608384 RepID=A0A6L5WJM6_9BACT|nr:hypothetical protein [Campylobacter portucalensis]MSN96447.1 hypothetical protein [Campylobacter portucalensis]
MICPRCANEKTSVKKTMKGFKNTRLRKCEKCGYVWLTEEKPVKDKEIIEYLEYLEDIGEFKK